MTHVQALAGRLPSVPLSACEGELGLGRRTDLRSYLYRCRSCGTLITITDGLVVKVTTGPADPSREPSRETPGDLPGCRD
jgi:hypothetical protein